MAVSRRKMLAIIGGGTIMAAGVGIGTFVNTRIPTIALQPWQKAGTYEEPRRRALSYALLAPNPHNRQPWEVDLSKEGVVEIYRDKSRNLPETDPLERQLTIGMGCFLELMTIAASQTGHGVELNLFPDGENGPVAVAAFTGNEAKPDPAFTSVMDRRSCKNPFSDMAVPDDLAVQLDPFATIIRDAPTVEKLRNLTRDAFTVEVSTPATLKESVDLMRIGKSEINAKPDGIDLGGPFLDTMAMIGMLTREGQLDTNSTEFQQGFEQYLDMLRATPAYAVIKTSGNTRENQIEAGRRWLRLNLATTSLGLALHPVSQTLQEYTEMKAHYERAHKILAANSETVQMLGRLGYGPSTEQTPRWPLETRIKNA